MSKPKCKCCVTSLWLGSCKLRQPRHFCHPIFYLNNNNNNNNNNSNTNNNDKNNNYSNVLFSLFNFVSNYCEVLIKFSLLYNNNNNNDNNNNNNKHYYMALSHKDWELPNSRI